LLAKVTKWFCGCHYEYWCAQSGKTVREERGEVGWRGEKFHLEEDVEGVDPWNSFPRPEIISIHITRPGKITVSQMLTSLFLVAI